jgi:hypothetical protein
MQLVCLLNFVGLFAYVFWLRKAGLTPEIVKKSFIRRPHGRG